MNLEHSPGDVAPEMLLHVHEKSWGSLGHLILRAFPSGVLGGSSGGT